MTAHSERRRVPYSPEQMFDLVADVAAYPKFIPFRESYTSLVKTFPAVDDKIARIDVEAISGPFNKLVTRYAFHPAGDGACDMTFDVDFAFRNRIMQRAAGAAFDIAMRKVAAAFEDRAKVLYGA